VNTWLLAAVLTTLALPAAAQDYDPALSAHESMSQQQFTTQQTRIYNDMLGDSVRRNQRATKGQIAACAKKEGFRAEFGEDNPKVRRLYALCRQIRR
jgi:hypothetical protein